MATTVNYGYQDALIHNESPRSTFVYKDLNLFFTKNPLSDDVSKVTDVQAVKRSIRNLVLTGRGERLFHPEIGGDIGTYLFELAGYSQITEVEIESAILNVITLYEPRAAEVTVNQGLDAVGDHDNNEIKVTVGFSLVNAPDEFHEVDIFIDRIR